MCQLIPHSYPTRVLARVPWAEQWGERRRHVRCWQLLVACAPLPVMLPHICCMAFSVIMSISLSVCHTNSMGRVQPNCSRNTCRSGAYHVC